jgi:DNA-binding IclR family transcriptional regulator
MVQKTVRAVERAIAVLEAIKARGGMAGVSEIGEHLDLPKSTTYRLLSTLEVSGMVYQDRRTDLYRLGHKVLELASTASQSWDVIGVAEPYLERMREELGETTTLALRFDCKYAYVRQVSSRHEHRVTPVLNSPYPLHWAATGKVILAYLPDGKLEECLQGISESRATPRTVTDRDLLLAQLREIRETMTAVSFGERTLGGAAVAAPIRDGRSEAFAAIALVGPESRVRESDLASTRKAVASFARAVEQACQAAGIGTENRLSTSEHQ